MTDAQAWLADIALRSAPEPTHISIGGTILFCLLLIALSVGLILYFRKQHHAVPVQIAVVCNTVVCAVAMLSLQVSCGHADNMQFTSQKQSVLTHETLSVLSGAFAVAEMPQDAYCIKHCFRYSKAFHVTGFKHGPETLIVTSDSGQVYVMGEIGAKELIEDAHVTPSALTEGDFNNLPDHDQSEQ